MSPDEMNIILLMIVAPAEGEYNPRTAMEVKGRLRRACRCAILCATSLTKTPFAWYIYLELKTV